MTSAADFSWMIMYWNAGYELSFRPHLKERFPGHADVAISKEELHDCIL